MLHAQYGADLSKQRDRYVAADDANGAHISPVGWSPGAAATKISAVSLGAMDHDGWSTAYLIDWLTIS
jgi:hypothetical protein